MDINIDSEFQQCFPPLTDSARQQLEQSILQDGCRDALVIWQGEPVSCDVCGSILEFIVEDETQTYVEDEYGSGHRETDVSLREMVGFWCDQCGDEIEAGRSWILLDGHNRYEICLEHDKWYPVVQAPDWITTRDDALLWILRNQEARRNLDEDALSLIRGKRYELEKRREGRPEKLDKSCQVSGSTRERLATEYGVSEGTIENDAKFSQAVEKITELKNPYFRENIMRGDRPEKWTPSGDREMTKAEIIEIGEALETHEELRELPTLDEVLYTNRAMKRETPEGQQEILEDVKRKTERIKEQRERTITEQKLARMERELNIEPEPMTNVQYLTPVPAAIVDPDTVSQNWITTLNRTQEAIMKDVDRLKIIIESINREGGFEELTERWQQKDIRTFCHAIIQFAEDFSRVGHELLQRIEG